MSAQALIFSALLLTSGHGQQRQEFEVISVKRYPIAPNAGFGKLLAATPVPHSEGNKFTEPHTSLQQLVK
jgi:hypothetical protein